MQIVPLQRRGRDVEAEGTGLAMKQAQDGHGPDGKCSATTSENKSDCRTIFSLHWLIWLLREWLGIKSKLCAGMRSHREKDRMRACESKGT